jgi:hypothetical protein
MKNKTKKSKIKETTIHQDDVTIQDDFFDRCIQKGLIQKTQNGFYFTPEFFETLNINFKK